MNICAVFDFPIEIDRGNWDLKTRIKTEIKTGGEYTYKTNPEEEYYIQATLYKACGE